MTPNQPALKKVSGQNPGTDATARPNQCADATAQPNRCADATARMVKEPGLPTNQISLQTTPRYTITQAVAYFIAWLKQEAQKKQGDHNLKTLTTNYPRIARNYLSFCHTNQYSYELTSLNLFMAGRPRTYSSAIRKFLLWYQLAAQPYIVADPVIGGGGTPAENEAILRFIADAHHLQGEESKRTYMKALNGFFRFLTSEQYTGRERSLSADSVAAYLDWLKQQNRSSFTRRLRLSVIRQFAKWIMMQGQRSYHDHPIPPELMTAMQGVLLVRAPKSSGGRYFKDSLTAVQRDKLLACITNPADRALVALMAWGGLRTIEIIRLRRQDVDLDQKRLFVQGKGQAERIDIALPDVCCDELTAYFRENARSSVPRHGLTGPHAGQAVPGQQPLFTSFRTTSAIRIRVRNYLRQSDLLTGRVSAHSLRHTAAQRLLDEGIDPVHVQRHLRHKQFETTLMYVRKKTDQDYYNQIH